MKSGKHTLVSKPKVGDACGVCPGDAPSWAGCFVSVEVLSEEECWPRRCFPVGCYCGSQPIPPTASLQVLGKSTVPLAITFATYLLTPLGSGSLLSGGRAEGEGEEGWGGTGTLLHRRWTVFLSSLPKGKEKASGGYSQGGSNSLFFHPAGEHILPSVLYSLAPRPVRLHTAVSSHSNTDR